MASKKSKNTGLVVMLLIVSIAGGAVMGAYVVSTPGALHVAEDMRRAKETAKAPKEPPQRLIPRYNSNGELTFQKEHVAIPAGEDARVYLINDYLKQLHEKGLGDPKAKALGIDLHNGIASVDFNQAFEESYGSMDEATLLQGIESVLGQFPDIDKVEFRIEGRTMQTTGNIDLTQPQDVIRPGQKPTDTSAASSAP